MAVTLRVYDSGKNYADRYALYFPTPRNKVKEWGYMGIYLGFNFSSNFITRFTYGECVLGIKSLNMGKKIKKDTLPAHVQKWINKQEEAYNKALKEDTEEAWKYFNELS